MGHSSPCRRINGVAKPVRKLVRTERSRAGGECNIVHCSSCWFRPDAVVVGDVLVQVDLVANQAIDHYLLESASLSTGSSIAQFRFARNWWCFGRSGGGGYCRVLIKAGEKKEHKLALLALEFLE